MYKIALIAAALAATCAGCNISKPLIRYFTLPPEDIRHILLSQQMESGSQFEPQTVHLVDFHSKSGNYLFRGNTPLINGSFSYELLMATCRNIAKNRLNRVLSDDAFLIDISLINPTVEKQELRQEIAFFNNNPDKGFLINHPVYGALASPNSYPEAQRKQLENAPDLGNMDKLVANIKTLIDTRKSTPQIIYVHCSTGYDRTGETIAAYGMHHSALSYECAYCNAN